MRFDPDEIKLDGLEKLVKALKIKNPPKILLGIVGTKPERSGGATNAEIGAAHEYGSVQRNLPARSFLRMPISEKLDESLKDAGMTDEGTLRKVITDGSIMPWLEKIKLIAKAIVIEAFDTEGFGKWRKWSRKYARRQELKMQSKKTGGRGTDNKILDDTGQLKGAIDAVIE
jgi:hypothetical protein